MLVVFPVPGGPYTGDYLLPFHFRYGKKQVGHVATSCNDLESTDNFFISHHVLQSFGTILFNPKAAEDSTSKYQLPREFKIVIIHL